MAWVKVHGRWVYTPEGALIRQGLHELGPSPAAPDPRLLEAQRALADHFNIEPFAPQHPHEPNVAYGLRKVLSSPLRLGEIFGNDLSKGANYAFGTPAGDAATVAAQRAHAPAQAVPQASAPQAAPQPQQVFAAPASPFPNSSLTIVKNNNPGALMNPDGTPMRFNSMEEGIQAQESLLHRRYFNKGLNTVSSIIDTYAPAGSQNTAQQTANYKAFVAQRLGVDPNAKLDAQTVPQLAAAMRDWETGNHKGGFSASGTSSGLQAPFANPFDPAYGDKAISALNAGEAAALKPQQVSFDRPAAPTMPKPTPIPETDFSASDAALQDAKPVPMSDKERLRVQREGWFRGIGQAMMNTPEGAGVGNMLMRIGGGALAGKGQADQTLLALDEKFSTAMENWHGAVYKNELAKAETHAKEAQLNVAQMNQYNLTNWQTQYQQWAKDNPSPSIIGDAIVTQTTADNKVTVNRVPIEAAVKAGFALHRAATYSGMMGVQNTGNGMVASANNAVVAAEATQAAAAAARSGDTAGQQTALVMAPAFAATAAVESGRAIDVFGGPEPYNAARAQVNARMKSDGWRDPLPYGDEAYAKSYREKFDQRLAEFMVQGALRDKNGNFQTRLFNSAAPGMLIQRAEQTRQSTTTRVDAKGRPTTSQTTTLGPLD